MQRNSAGLVLLLLSLVAPAVNAEEASSPLTVEADQLELNQQTGVSIYQGNVRMQRASMLLQAERLELHSDGNRVQLAIADGEPVHLERDDPQSGEQIRAEATHMEYRIASGQLELRGEAHLWRGGDEFSGNHLIYDSSKRVVRAFGDKKSDDDGRVRVILQPEQETQP